MLLWGPPSKLRLGGIGPQSVIFDTEFAFHPRHHAQMDHYKCVVMEYLQSDRTVFVNTSCCIRLDDPANPDKGAPHWSCDAVAIDLRHRALYVCDISYKLQALVKKMAAWTHHWEAIQAALRRDCKVPETWRIHVWLFVPKDTVEMLDAKLEDLRRTSGAPFKVKITALEDVQPWRFWTWDRTDADSDTIRGRDEI
jgi:hypothetical protein